MSAPPRGELDWIRSDQIGLDWIGLDWIGLDQIGLESIISYQIRSDNRVEGLGFGV